MKTEITEEFDYHKIKTYEDACKAIGVKPIARLLVEDKDGKQEEVGDISHLAYIKLCTVVRALNNDPGFPRFKGKEERWHPYFWLNTNGVIDSMDEEKRKKLLLFSNKGKNAFAGLRFGHTSCMRLDASSLSPRLYVKSKELAVYCGNQFEKLWKDFIIGLP